MSNDEFGDRLLELEGYPEELRKSLEEAATRVREVPLTKWTRAGILYWCIPMAFGAMVYLGFKALTAGAEVPLLNRIGAGIVAVMCGALLVWALATLRRGTERLRDSTVITNVAFAFVVVVLCVSLFQSKDVEADLVAGIVVVGFAATWARVKASELQLRENILRVELGMINLMKDAKAGLNTKPGASVADEQQ